jgi:hypothetical protein
MAGMLDAGGWVGLRWWCSWGWLTCLLRRLAATGVVNHFYVYAVDADFGPFGGVPGAV